MALKLRILHPTDIKGVESISYIGSSTAKRNFLLTYCQCIYTLIKSNREKHFQALTLEVFTALSLDEEIFGSLNMMSYYSEVTFDVD